jgi:predicted nucleic acid-binding protein
MIAFFDTNVHLGLLLGSLTSEEVLEHAERRRIRLSPVVGHELLRGASGRARRSVETLVRQLLPIEPPSWRRCWTEAGRLLPRIFPHHEEIGLARLQNDILLAATARHTGALFLTRDGHFRTIREHVPFRLRWLSSP